MMSLDIDLCLSSVTGQVYAFLLSMGAEDIDNKRLLHQSAHLYWQHKGLKRFKKAKVCEWMASAQTMTQKQWKQPINPAKGGVFSFSSIKSRVKFKCKMSITAFFGTISEEIQAEQSDKPLIFGVFTNKHFEKQVIHSLPKKMSKLGHSSCFISRYENYSKNRSVQIGKKI